MSEGARWRRRTFGTAVWALSSIASTGRLSAAHAADDRADELPVTVSIDGQPVASDFIILQRDGKLYLPLVGTATLLSFVVHAPRPDFASGHRGDPTQRYYIVAGRAHAVIDARDTKIALDDAVVADGMMWVTGQLAARLLPVRAELDAKDLVLRLTSTGELPQAAERRRAKQHRALAADGDARSAAAVPRREAFDYRPIGAPSGDLQLLARARDGRAEVGLRALLATDLAWMNGAVFIAADGDGIDEARVRLTRESADGGVFGVPSLTRVEVGDVYGTHLPLVGSSPGGRGFALGSFALDQQTQFDATRLEGDAPPGWQIEVYGNGRLLAFQQVGADGRYLFDDLPVLFGENQYRLAFYGPGGERREELRTVRVGADRLPSGEWRWRVAANQPDRSLLGFDEARRSGSSPATSAEMRVGLREWLTAGAFVARAPSSSEIRSPLANYAGGLLRGALGSVVVNLDVVAQDNDSVGGSVGIITQLAGTSVSARVSEYGGLATPESSRAGELLDRESFLRLNRPLPGWLLRNADVGLEVGRADYAGGRSETRITPLVRHQLGAVSLEHELQYQRTGTERVATSHWQLRSAVAFSMGTTHLRAQVAARTDGIDGVSVSGLRSLGPQSHLGFNFSRQMEDQQDDLSAYLARDFGWFTGRVVAGHSDTEGSYGMLELSLSFAFAPDGRPVFSSRRLASGGLAAPFVYLDRDNNGRYDPGRDDPLPGVRIAIDDATRPTVSDVDGELLIDSLPTLTRTRLGIDPLSLGDPFYEPGVPTLSFQARPGTTFRTEFPVVETGSIQGHVYRQAGTVRSPVRGVTLNLVDKTGTVAAQAISQPDGYYVFERVMPGSWQVVIRVDPTRVVAPRAATISSTTLQIDDLDFTL